jgi:hypothetical protein
MQTKIISLVMLSLVMVAISASYVPLQKPYSCEKMCFETVPLCEPGDEIAPFSTKE